jgi:hypothetical protein
LGLADYRAGALARPRAARPASRPRRPRLRLEVLVWWRGIELDRRLAAGEDPWASDALALRARRLTSARSRRHVADGLAGVLRSAGNGRPGFTAAVRPRSGDVLEAIAAIASIERRLRAPAPVGPRGMALVRLLLIDGNGPLYRPGDPGALDSRLRSAAVTLNAPGAGD